MDIKERSDDDREDKNEEHTQLESLRQLAYFLEERCDDGEGSDGQNNHQLIQRTCEQQRQTGTCRQKQYTQAQADEHASGVLTLEHAAVVLNIFGLHLFVLAPSARDVGVGENLTEYLVSAADDEEDIRRRQNHLKR